MEVPLPWERLLWSGRSACAPRTRYLLTDFRLVRRRGREADELAIQDVADIQRRQTPLDRLLGTSTIVFQPRSGRRPPFVLAHVRRGAPLAALIELLAGDPRANWDAESVQAALAWEPAPVHQTYRPAFVGVGGIMLTLFAVVVGLHGKTAAIFYPPDDRIYPAGVKRQRADIEAFMTREVLPWARQALAPIVGGADRVTCQTCHGLDGESAEWRMPAVSALPLPDVTMRGWERWGGPMDAQMRNAIYGYVAESDNQTKATYMREVVLPGMAALLHRPPYDFTRPYDYNRSRLAFGCYHCHRVK
ncbi:MAG TPA: PH domain-containing protein [Vicinamibacterales bacterium]